MKILGAQHESLPRNPRFLQGLNAKGPRQCAKERAEEEKLTGTRGQFKVRQLSMRLGIHVMDTGVTDDALGHPPTTLTEIRSIRTVELSPRALRCVRLLAAALEAVVAGGAVGPREVLANVDGHGRAAVGCRAEQVIHVAKVGREVALGRYLALAARDHAAHLRGMARDLGVIESDKVRVRAWLGTGARSCG